MKKTIFLGCLLFAALTLSAQLRLPHIFGEGMVLQRDMPLRIWGWAGKNEKITIHFHQQQKTVKAGKDGRWAVQLDPETAGGPYVLELNGKTNIKLGNILVGDVWLCSGQSNMEWNVRSSSDAANVIAQSANDNIRHFTVQKAVAASPEDDVAPASWLPADPANTGDFTAVGYFFARELQAALKIPIGLIHSSWGGTDIETWISREGLAGSAEFSDLMGSLPRLNLDSMQAQRKAALDKLVNSVQGGLPQETDASVLAAPATDISRWPRMEVPGVWEGQQLKQLDGVVWFRRTVRLSREQAAGAQSIELGTIDDNDITYINGQKIGSTNMYNIARSYRIPAGLLKEGENTIVVRIDDTGGGGGFYGDADALKITGGQWSVPLAGTWSFLVEKVSTGSTSVGPNSYPSLLYNGMIHPLIPFGIKGAIWYQGENNAGRAAQYATAFPLMISDWRRLWKEGDFPFYFVQLASFIAGDGDSRKGSAWAELREAQTSTLSLPHTGMAVTTDIGERNDIHPKNKLDVGRRLAAAALQKTYGQNRVAGGPVYASMEKRGNQLLLQFNNTGSGLHTPDQYGYLRGFEIAGEDQQFYYAKAWIENGKVVLMSDKVQQPVAVRYAWADDAGEANLYNAEGFPALPFRTDKWKGITTANKYQVP